MMLSAYDVMFLVLSASDVMFMLMVFYVCGVIVMKAVSDVMLPVFMMSSVYVCGGVIMFVVACVCGF